ncbi:MAG: hypothetical protein Q4F17_06075 [Eubacteriales bacterium]|nr:hypothetical protein [Eubacteriales bacterium]
MKKFVRAAALLLCLAMIGSLVACGSKTQTTTGTDAAAEAVQSADSFHFYSIATGIETAQYNAHPIAAMIEAHTGYHVIYDQAPANAEDAAKAITNIFMSRSEYDAIVVSKAQFYSLLAMDALKDITPYVEKSTNLKNVISEFGWSTATKDGSIYGIPQKDAKKCSNFGIAFRVDWLEEYNAANPDTQIPVPSEENAYTMSVSSFKTMLEFFKTKVPQGGSAFNVDMNGVMQECILPAFGVVQEWADVNGQLEYYINQPGFQDYLSYMQGLYDEGLVSYQSTAEADGTVKLLQGKLLGAGKVFHWNAAAIEKTETQELDDSIGYISVLVADEDFGDLSKVRQFANEGYSMYTVVPKYADDAKAAAVVDWADKKLDKDFFLKMVMGTEGETYRVQDGAYYPILPTFDEKQSISDKFMTGTREEDYAKYWLCRTRKTQAQDKMFSRTNLISEQSGVKSPVTVMPPNETFDQYFSGASSEVTNALITTMFSADRRSLEEIQTLFQTNSGDEITAAVNEWYTSWGGRDTFNPAP